MKAIVQRVYGPPGILEVGEVDQPVPGDGEVLVRVRASSVNFGDLVTTRGVPYAARLVLGPRRPRHRVPGHDLAGVVEAVGPGVTRFGPGDAVYGEVVAGAYAEYARVPEKFLAAMPGGLSFEEAAAVPVAGNTALKGLRDAGRLRAGQSVLVNGASGGVGTFSVQVAKALGAEVTGVCRTRNVELVRSLGADEVIDYTRADFAQAGRRFDVILDLVGNRSLRELTRLLNPGGVLVLSSGGGGTWLGPMGRILRAVVMSPFGDRTLRSSVAGRSAGNLATLKELIESGAVRPHVECAYPLGEVPDALRHFEERHARSKIAITV
ncbi:NAD(P)-dependent alcohol dehydrogenase [Nonomuraea sp. NPDC050478]|uniref:NAD(P)-dependent alcohol dehydrogenase n=1 Tax=Nonomuraea sp. NPDC050478 TaxID=3364365 RepID=UPI00378D57DD